jgi:hypothetical protein
VENEYKIDKCNKLREKDRKLSGILHLLKQENRNFQGFRGGEKRKFKKSEICA